jgi:hypothetical protein
MEFLEQAMEQTTYLIVKGAFENKVLLYLHLMYMENPTYPLLSWYSMHPKLMRTYSELAQGDLGPMHLVSKHVRGPHYEVVSKLHEVLCLKGHLWSQTPRGVIQVT